MKHPELGYVGIYFNVLYKPKRASRWSFENSYTSKTVAVKRAKEFQSNGYDVMVTRQKRDPR